MLKEKLSLLACDANRYLVCLHNLTVSMRTGYLNLSTSLELVKSICKTEHTIQYDCSYSALKFIMDAPVMHSSCVVL